MKYSGYTSVDVGSSGGHWTAVDDDISNCIMVKFNRQGTAAGHAW